jgi:hypothetical protein
MQKAVPIHPTTRKNIHKSFVGYDTIKRKQKKQLEDFEKWAAEKNWKKFHHSHYDWWMFPIELDSSFGWAYTCFSGDIEELIKDKTYIENYKRGVEVQQHI